MHMPQTTENMGAVTIHFIIPFTWNVLKKTNSNCKIGKRD